MCVTNYLRRYFFISFARILLFFYQSMLLFVDKKVSTKLNFPSDVEGKSFLSKVPRRVSLCQKLMRTFLTLSHKIGRLNLTEKVIETKYWRLSNSTNRNRPRVGVIVEWPLNWKFNDHRDVILTSRLVVWNLTLMVAVKKIIQTFVSLYQNLSFSR